MKTYKNIIDLIGNTPLIELQNFNKKNNLKAKIFAKLESFNPAGSSKDRVAYSMIKDAIDKGLLKENSTVIEPTSGNTGIGLSAICSYLGYKIILTMPETMSIERIQLLKAYGADIVLTPANDGMQGAVEKALALSKEIPNSFIPSQFENPANPKIHFETTGFEIWNDLDGQIDIFVATVGTGGTLSGIGEYLKSKNKNIKIVAVEPKNSPLLSEGKAGKHNIQGIGANFIPKILNTKIYDEIITIEDNQAYQMCKELVKTEGLLQGISSGASLYAAYILANREENKDKNIVTLFPDSGEKYLTTPAFQ